MRVASDRVIEDDGRFVRRVAPRLWVRYLCKLGWDRVLGSCGERILDAYDGPPSCKHGFMEALGIVRESASPLAERRKLTAVEKTVDL